MLPRYLLFIGPHTTLGFQHRREIRRFLRTQPLHVVRASRYVKAAWFSFEI